MVVVKYIYIGLFSLLAAADSFAGTILFIGNSFTFAYGSPVRYYRPNTVTDLNSEGQGGVPALFKSFTVQSGLSYDVFLETHPGIGIDWHLENKLSVIGQRPWDTVVMHGYSTLDAKKPGDPALLSATALQMADFLRGKNPKVDLRLTATWPRADQTYGAKGAWYGKPIEAMAKDLGEGYEQAASAAKIKSVIPVGAAWIRAMHEGIADSNPYDGIDAGKVDLWTYDNYHASSYGYYLEALMVFGSVTGLDPRTLGAAECSGFELGMSSTQVSALEQVAYDELSADKIINAAAAPAAKPGLPGACAPVH